MALVTMDFASGGSGGVKAKSGKNITVSVNGEKVDCGFKPTKIYVTINQNNTYLGYYCYDEETNINEACFKGTATAIYKQLATFILAIQDDGFTIKAINPSWASSNNTEYNYIAIG